VFLKKHAKSDNPDLVNMAPEIVDFSDFVANLCSSGSTEKSCTDAKSTGERFFTKVIKAGFLTKPKNPKGVIFDTFVAEVLFYRPSVGLCETSFD
jgi:hypothetical protein